MCPERERKGTEPLPPGTEARPMAKGNPKKLSKLVIDNLKVPKGRDRIRVFDTLETGLAVVKFASGKVSFQFIYGPRQRRRAYTIGQYGRWTVAQARERAKALAVAYSNGVDPVAEKRAGAEDKRQTFRRWVTDYLSVIKETKRSWKRDEVYLRWACDRIGATPLSEVTMADVQRLALRVRAEGTGKAAPGKARALNATANRFLAALSGCFALAVKRELIPKNPAHGIESFKENPPRQRVLNDDELRRVLKAVAELPDPFTQAAMVLLLETGCRVSEALRAKWEDFDLKNGTWNLPWPKSGRDREAIPLASSTVKMLSDLEREEGSPFVVPGMKKGTHRVELTTQWAAVQKAAGIPDVHLHDIRRTVGLALYRIGGIHLASKVLRHSSVSITSKIYAPLSVQELRSAMDKVTEDQGNLLKFEKVESK
jgi:integrase